jgi:signal transduction histidine kinase
VHGDTLGSLIVGFAAERSFDPDDQAFLLTMAGQCAIAVNRVQLHTAAETARHAAELALRARDDFLRTLAHDLKTPLTALVWHVQLLRHDDAQAARGHAAAAEMSARELMADIDELRDLIRDQQGDTRILQPEKIDLVALVGEAVSSTNDDGGHHIRLVTEESLLVVEGDRGRLKRALSNLLDNALKYSARGSEVRVDVRTVEQAEQTWSVVEVTDHGIGIPAADLPLVFNRYHRGANVANATAGEGIGLESARQSVEWHGGRLTVHSVEGSGSSFTIWLPSVRAG